MRELTCIVCPIGCSLVVEEGSAPGEEGFTITGNRCPRGVAYAQEEIRAPKRVVTATCGIVFPAGEGPDQGGPHRSLTAPRRIPVKSSAPCPKDKIDELLGDIYRLRMSLPVKAGDKLIMDWEGSGINVIAVRNLE
jgi:CxxC motif-containing protein